MDPTTATTGQPLPIMRGGGDGTVMYGILTAAILALATVIVVLWRRDVRRADRALKLAEERASAERAARDAEAKAAADREAAAVAAATAREVARTDAVMSRLATERGEFVKALESTRDAFTQALEAERESNKSDADRQWERFEATIRAVVERQATADVARDTRLAEAVTQLGHAVAAATAAAARPRRSPP